MMKILTVSLSIAYTFFIATALMLVAINGNVCLTILFCGAMIRDEIGDTRRKIMEGMYK